MGADWESTAGLAVLFVTIPFHAVSLFLFQERKKEHPIRGRYPNLVLCFVGSFLFWYYMGALLAAFQLQKGADCRIWLMGVGYGGTFTLFFLTMRAWKLAFHYELLRSVLSVEQRHGAKSARAGAPLPAPVAASGAATAVTATGTTPPSGLASGPDALAASAAPSRVVLPPPKRLRDWKPSWFVRHRHWTSDRVLKRWCGGLFVFLAVCSAVGMNLEQTNSCQGNSVFTSFLVLTAFPLLALECAVMVFCSRRLWSMPNDAFNCKGELRLCALFFIGDQVLAHTLSLLTGIDSHVTTFWSVLFAGPLLVYLVTTRPVMQSYAHARLEADRVVQIERVVHLKELLVVPQGYDAFLRFTAGEFTSRNVLFWNRVRLFARMPLPAALPSQPSHLQLYPPERGERGERELTARERGDRGDRPARSGSRASSRGGAARRSISDAKAGLAASTLPHSQSLPGMVPSHALAHPQPQPQLSPHAASTAAAPDLPSPAASAAAVFVSVGSAPSASTSQAASSIPAAESRAQVLAQAQLALSMTVAPPAPAPAFVVQHAAEESRESASHSLKTLLTRQRLAEPAAAAAQGPLTPPDAMREAIAIYNAYIAPDAPFEVMLLSAKCRLRIQAALIRLHAVGASRYPDEFKQILLPPMPFELTAAAALSSPRRENSRTHSSHGALPPAAGSQMQPQIPAVVIHSPGGGSVVGGSGGSGGSGGTGSGGPPASIHSVPSNSLPGSPDTPGGSAVPSLVPTPASAMRSLQPRAGAAGGSPTMGNLHAAGAGMLLLAAPAPGGSPSAAPHPHPHGSPGGGGGGGTAITTPASALRTLRPALHESALLQGVGDRTPDTQLVALIRHLFDNAAEEVVEAMHRTSFLRFRASPLYRTFLQGWDVGQRYHVSGPESSIATGSSGGTAGGTGGGGGGGGGHEGSLASGQYGTHYPYGYGPATHSAPPQLGHHVTPQSPPGQRNLMHEQPHVLAQAHQSFAFNRQHSPGHGNALNAVPGATSLTPHSARSILSSSTGQRTARRQSLRDYQLQQQHQQQQLKRSSSQRALQASQAAATLMNQHTNNSLLDVGEPSTRVSARSGASGGSVASAPGFPSPHTPHSPQTHTPLSALSPQQVQHRHLASQHQQRDPRDLGSGIGGGIGHGHPTIELSPSAADSDRGHSFRPARESFRDRDVPGAPPVSSMPTASAVASFAATVALPAADPASHVPLTLKRFRSSGLADPGGAAGVPGLNASPEEPLSPGSPADDREDPVSGYGSRLARLASHSGAIVRP